MQKREASPKAGATVLDLAASWIMSQISTQFEEVIRFTLQRTHIWRNASLCNSSCKNTTKVYGNRRKEFLSFSLIDQTQAPTHEWQAVPNYATSPTLEIHFPRVVLGLEPGWFSQSSHSLPTREKMQRNRHFYQRARPRSSRWVSEGSSTVKLWRSRASLGFSKLNLTLIFSFKRWF